VLPLGQSALAETDWRNEWQVADGFSLAIDSEGYDFPTTITFVPNPGSDPKSPLYFVTEIRGKVKVVTNDRSIYTFADVTANQPSEELPALTGETGMAGLVLEPEKGYVFVSYAYRDPANFLRNTIVRFETKPHVFGLEPDSSTSFEKIFAAHPSHLSHQIGPMAIHGGHLYVGVGDAEQPPRARDIDSPIGKILRMTLDGKPVPGNPFYEDDDILKPRNFVWAYGLRNPFGLTFVGDELFVTDNGPAIDRFLRIERGEDYKYEGTDWSIGSRADVIFSPGVGPVTVRFLPWDSTLFPTKYRSRFYVALGGFLGHPPGPGFRGDRSLVTIPWDLAGQHAARAPEPFLQFRGPGIQLPVSLEFGPDGLYVVPLLPDASGRTAILKMRYDPENQHPLLISENMDGRAIMFARGCFGCHSLDPKDVLYGPTLARGELLERLDLKLNDPTYMTILDAFDMANTELTRATTAARQEVREAKGLDRIRAYIKHQIMHPDFDGFALPMPELGISEKEAVAIRDYLLSADEEGLSPLKAMLLKMIPRLRWRHLALFFAVGMLAGGAGTFISMLVIRRARRA
jgi:hypothetical protein